MTTILGTRSNFSSLSLKDLLQARDLYHYHLLNKVNVVGTAIGLYLIRNTDPRPGEKAAPPGRKQPLTRRDKSPRTFLNSSVRNYSWPCVLVLVRDWRKESDFGSVLHPEEMVPKTLYMPDGRMVPVCVVKVEQAEPDSGLVPAWHWPDNLYGGGMPILVESQKVERRATVGCLVSDGHTTYALTSRHVCGWEGEPVSTMAGGWPAAIGKASARHLTRLPFNEVYSNFPAQLTYVNLDVGLIEIDDLRDWTSQIFGLGAVGPIADLNDQSLSLRLINAPVVAHGAASGRLDGQIKALFYRYKSIGGYDYVADFLISPERLDANRNGKPSRRAVQTQPGDSGAVWHLETESEHGADGRSGSTPPKKAGGGDKILRPLAVEWGGQAFVENSGTARYSFALATSLTTVCRLLNVELVLEHNTGVQPYWGQTGHYSIASFACRALPNGRLKTFMADNLDRISFSIAELTPKEISERLKTARENGNHGGFVPLADVPDVIWKQHYTKVRGGRDDQWAGNGRTTGPEHPTHYADIDQARSSDKKTLLELCRENPNNISVQFWQEFYDKNDIHESRDRGLLPFRVWQFFNAMADFASRGSADKFLCAAGLVAHYVGDACQPLHGSIYSDGYADQKKIVTHTRKSTGEVYEEESHRGAGVHSTYESKMIDRFARDIVREIPKLLSASGSTAPVSSGKEAARAIIALMDRSAKSIPPRKLVEAYIDAGEKSIVAVQKALWESFGKQTIAVMADGARVLARIWKGAWAAGNGNAISNSKLGKIDHAPLIKHYRNRKFVESLDLDHIAAELK